MEASFAKVSHMQRNAIRAIELYYIHLSLRKQFSLVVKSYFEKLLMLVYIWKDFRSAYLIHIEYIALIYHENRN